MKNHIKFTICLEVINGGNKMRILIIVLTLRFYVDAVPIEESTDIPTTVRNVLENKDGEYIQKLLKNHRRIMRGKETFNNRPYMVYLKLPTYNQKYQNYRSWICAGVIIHEEYILTSAACIEDTKYFYVVSGTFTHDQQDNRKTDVCLKNGSKRAIWKCIPRNYVFDGQENDNLKWMNNDIAIVKVEDEFDFTRRIRGCDFIPKPIAYNNQSDKLEEPGTLASIAGWGTTKAYGEWLSARRQNTKHPLMDAQVVLISKRLCKNRWGSRYYNIIENYMICSKDLVSEMSEICSQKFTECKDIMFEDENEFRRAGEDDGKEIVHSAFHNDSIGRRAIVNRFGGFCENDHGGPLVYGEGVNAVVLGIISACLVKERTNKCYGPFLYTSVYKNRFLINCSINKATTNCDKMFRSSSNRVEETISWKDHPDGPSKPEILESRRREGKLQIRDEANIDDSKKYASGSGEFKDVNISYVAPILEMNMTPEPKQVKVATTTNKL